MGAPEVQGRPHRRALCVAFHSGGTYAHWATLLQPPQPACQLRLCLLLQRWHRVAGLLVPVVLLPQREEAAVALLGYVHHHPDPNMCWPLGYGWPCEDALNFANLITAVVTTPFFYGIMKRWKEVPKLPVFLATATISYQVAMGVMGPITGAVDLKLYDPSCIFQHGVVDIGFGLAYAASIICGVFKPGMPRPKWAREEAPQWLPKWVRDRVPA